MMIVQNVEILGLILNLEIPVAAPSVNPLSYILSLCITLLYSCKSYPSFQKPSSGGLCNRFTKSLYP